MIDLARRLADHPVFQTFILGVIVLAAILIGAETSEPLMARYGPAVDALELVVQAIFVVEIAIRLLAYWPRLGAFFRDAWNVFDFVVVVTSLLPQAGAFTMVARLARLMRVTRVVSLFPELRLIIATMLRSIPSMGHVIVMLSLLLYVYAVLGFYFFRDDDPGHWGTLGAALLTLFQILTLEGWVEIQENVLPTTPWAWAFFASFIFVGVFVVVNLFIAVVINNLESVKDEQQATADDESPHRAVLRTIEDIRAQLDGLEQKLRAAPEALRVAPPNR